MSFIRRARHLGISLDDVRELLTLADDRDESCGGVDSSCRQGTVGDCKIIEPLGPQISEWERQRSPKELTVGHGKAKEVT